MINKHGIEARRLLELPGITFVHIELKPGEKIDRHSAEGDAFFFVLEGTGTLYYGMDDVAVTRDTLVRSQAGNLHGWHNTSDSLMRILAIKL